MASLVRILSLSAVLLLLADGLTDTARAQGVTSAAVRGAITREGGAPVEGAIVILTRVDKGTRQRVTTGASGRYFLENVEPGGPYTLEVRAIGFEPATKTGIHLALGQRYDASLELRSQPVVLQELEVVAATDPLINSARTGPAQTVSDTAIQRLPLLGRNFASLLLTNPQVVPNGTGANAGISIGGQNNRFNTIQIDGGVNNDLFGLAASGTPGGQASLKPISLEALKEFQVLTAPFDVRQGSFSGGLVNAVTRSGTNEWGGSLFGYLQHPSLVGKDTAGNRIAQFDIKQFGGTLSGPVIRDRVHFFTAVDWQSRETPFGGPEAGEPTTGISVALAERVRELAISKYGFDPGGPEPPINENPDRNVFAKVNWAASENTAVELSHNYVNGADENFNRSTRNRNDRDGWQLSESGYRFKSVTHSTRLKGNRLFGHTNVEALLGYQRIREKRQLANEVPLLLVQGELSGNWLAAGGEKFSHRNALDQNIFEVTANATIPLGGSHAVTIGTHNEFFSFLNVFHQAAFGVWSFNSLADFEAETASRYERRLELRPGAATADFSVRQLGGYLQDRWNPTDNLTLTFGLRMDVPIFGDKPVRNEALAAVSFNGITPETDNFPSGNLLFSPRFGFNYDVWGTGKAILRGGVGIFSGRPPYVWMSNAFTGTGQEVVDLICTGAAVPTFTADPNNQPEQCATGGPPTPPIPSPLFFDDDFKFQQALKFAAGVDYQLPGGIVATVDALHTRNRNHMYLNDINLIPGEVNGEGRQMYGAISATSSTATPNRISSAFRTVIRHENRTRDRSTLLTGQLQKRFSDGLEFSAAYTWSENKEVFFLGSSIASSNLNFTALDGTLANRNLANSALHVPHTIVVSGTANIPLGFVTSVIYRGRAGRPYAYTVTNDANADGITANDLLYIPTSAADISLSNAADFDRLNTFIVGEDCLLEQRGRIMERNSCRNPWVHNVDARLGKVLRTFGGQSMEFTIDFFNFLNLLNDDWGVVRETNFFETRTGVLSVAGYDNRGTADPTDDRPRYSVAAILPNREQIQITQSRWRIQMGLKYLW